MDKKTFIENLLKNKKEQYEKLKNFKNSQGEQYCSNEMLHMFDTGMQFTIDEASRLLNK